MAKSGDSKGVYKLKFTNFDGSRFQLTLYTRKDRDSTQIHVNNLIDEKRHNTQTAEGRAARNWVREEASERLKQTLVSRGLFVDEKANRKKIGDLIDHFSNKTGVEKTTVGTYNLFSENLIDFFGRDKILEDITVLDARNFENFLRTKAKRKVGKGTKKGCAIGQGLSDATVGRRIEIARQFFREAVRLRWIAENPFQEIKGNKAANPERWLYIPAETVVQVMDNTPNLEIRALIALARFMGARGASEFNSLEWNESWIRWSTEGQPGTVRLYRKKTKKSGFVETIVPMIPIVENALRDLYESAPDGQVKVFKQRNNPGKVIKDKFLANGIDIIESYNLRRSYTNDLMEAGLDPKAYEYYAGHSLKIALQNYQIWDARRERKTQGQFLAIFQTGTGQPENGGATNQTENNDLRQKQSGQFRGQLPEKVDSFVDSFVDSNRPQTLVTVSQNTTQPVITGEVMQEKEKPLQTVARVTNRGRGIRTPNQGIMSPLL